MLLVINFIAHPWFCFPLLIVCNLRKSQLRFFFFLYTGVKMHGTVYRNEYWETLATRNLI